MSATAPENLVDPTVETEPVLLNDYPPTVRQRDLKFSVFTPTHNPQYLEETYSSLLAQNVDWEWLICPNGDAVGNLPAAVLAEPRARVLPAPPMDLPKIGALKRFCCEAAMGDVFVELDHDDLLVPGILELVQEKVHDGAGFVYSDTAVFSQSSTNPDEFLAQSYSADYGWETYPIQVYDRQLMATRAFPVDARTLCEIYYAPDHVRCWTRDAYYEAGGHDPNLEVGDDHDLLIRTYLKGVPFAHTGTCGYLYRFHASNTVASHNEQIQVQNRENRRRYLWGLIDQWCLRQGHAYLDFSKREYISKVKFFGTTDQSRCRIDAADHSIGCVKVYDYLHRHPMSACISLLNEIHRVLVPGGWLCLAVPSTSGVTGFLPYAKSYWNNHTLDYLVQRHYADVLNAELAPTRLTARFQLVQNSTIPSRDSNAERLGAKTLIADLMAVKEGAPGQPLYRVPGKVYI